MLFSGAGRRAKRDPGRAGGTAPWSARGRGAPSPAGASGGEDGADELGAILAPGPAGLGQVRGKARGADLKGRVTTATFAFRGYDVANLGRSPELLAHPAYGPTVRRFLDEASAVSAATLGREFDLAARVEAREPTTLGSFAEDIATIVAMELAQMALLREFFGVETAGARQNLGYSIGEMAALVVGGVFTMEELLPIPLGCAADCATLAEDTTLGVVFSRGQSLALRDVQALCTEVSGDGRGMVGVSAYLSPNTILLIGQGDTLDRVERALPAFLPDKVMLRRKSHKIPPLHTPLVWQRNVTNRAAVELYRIGGRRQAPAPRVVSCVTGTACYDATNARDVLIRWVDQPQLLWDVVCDTLASDVDLVIHAGPAPNLIPATFERLSNNVEKQLGNKYMRRLGRRVGLGMNRHAWLTRLLPSKAALLRAVHIEHVVLEDWLLEQKPD